MENPESKIIKNPSASRHPATVIKEISTFRGMLVQVFGDDSEKITKEKTSEFYRNQIRNTFGKKDVDEIMPPILDEPKTFALLETLFRFVRLPNSDE